MAVWRTFASAESASGRPPLSRDSANVERSNIVTAFFG